MLFNKAFNLNFKQSEVDFLIPNLNEDLQLYVDPFLLYKSSNPEYQAVHATLQKFFNIALENIKEGKNDVARKMLDFPEVKETMLGVSKGNHQGRGLGTTRGEIIYKEIVSNPDLLTYGIKHLSEMQLLIEGVGPDMVSDMCTNIAKNFFIKYTQRQCQIHNIPMDLNICLDHVFDWEDLYWDDIHVNLPVNPYNYKPILLVPKAILRKFSEIDYKDFWDTTYRFILREIEIQKSIQALGKEPKITWKEIEEKYDFCKKTVVEILHKQPDLKRDYIKQKEITFMEDFISEDISKIEGTDKELTPIEDYVNELKSIIPGNKDAKKYEGLMVRILSRLFYPFLANPHSQVYSNDNREIIDITFHNTARYGFWHDIKTKHGNIIIPIELKNMENLQNEEYNQISSRLNQTKGFFGILISRKKDNLDTQRAYRKLFNENKVIITITDEDIINMLNNLKDGLSKTMYIENMYRKFIEEA